MILLVIACSPGIADVEFQSETRWRHPQRFNQSNQTARDCQFVFLRWFVAAALLLGCVLRQAAYPYRMARAHCVSRLTEHEATIIPAQVYPRSRWKNSRKPTPPKLSITLALLLFGARVAEAFLSMPGALHKPEATVMDLDGALNRGAKLRRESLLLTSSGGRHDIPALSPPVLELITPDGCASSSETSPLIRSVDRAVAGGVSLVQLRDYDSDAKSKAELAIRLAATTEGRAWFVVNGEPETARECCADGVHLPERMVDRLVDLRTEGEWPRIVGCSVHSVAAALKAARMGADYVQVGTMFPTKSHPGKEPEGVGMLNDVRRELDAEGFGGVLVIGVGGIDASNAGKVAAAGGDGVAAISCLCKSEDAEGEARGITDALRANAVSARGRA